MGRRCMAPFFGEAEGNIVAPLAPQAAAQLPDEPQGVDPMPPDNLACRIPTWHILFVTVYAFTAAVLFGPHVTKTTETRWGNIYRGDPGGLMAVPLDLPRAMDNLIKLFFT